MLMQPMPRASTFRRRLGSSKLRTSEKSGISSDTGLIWCSWNCCSTLRTGKNWTFATEHTEHTEGILMPMLLCDLGVFCGMFFPYAG